MKTELKNKNTKNISRSVLFMVLLILLLRSFPGAEPLFKLSKFSGALILNYQYTNSIDKYLENVIRELDLSFLEAGIELNTEGSIYHPNFITFKLSLNLVGNRSEKIFFSDEKINEKIRNSYSMDIHFLPRKKINFSLYAKKNSSSADRYYSERFFFESRSRGIRINNRSKFLPFNLNIFKFDSRSETINFIERIEKSNNILFNAQLLRLKNVRSNFNLMWRDYSEEKFDIYFKTLNFTGNIYYNFGISGRNQAMSILSYQKMSRDLDTEIIKLKSGFSYYLNDFLILNGNHSFSVDTSGSRSAIRNYFKTSLVHSLFESLTTTISAGYRTRDTDFESIRSHDTDIRFGYRKNIKIGTLFLGYEKGIEKGNYRSKSDIALEKVVKKFSIADTIILSVNGVRQGSIELTNEDLTRVYVEGIDFQVDFQDNYLTIVRIPGGVIPRESRVIISYEFLSYPDHDLTVNTSNFDFNINLLKYFNFFYRKRISEMSVESQFLLTPYNSYNDEEYGIRFNLKNLNGDYILRNYKSDLTNYFSRYFRVSAGVTLLRFIRLTGNFSSRRMTNKPSDRFNNFDSYSGNLLIRLGSNVNFSTTYQELLYEQLDHFNNRESLIFRFKWRFRKIIIDIFYEHFMNEYDFNNRKRSYLNIMVRRYF
ncbi:MAG: hypothetical protein ABFR75_02560 [Acidobacteriota bacterium]